MVKKILVLGSCNVDLIFKIPRFHNPGETIMGENLVTAFGGKGANQAMAAKRLGGKIQFIAKLGNDSYGKSYRKFLLEKGLPGKFLLHDKERPTGIALIEINPKGENRIIVSPGANGSLSKEDLQSFNQFWRGIHIFVVQLEIPLSTVKIALGRAKNHGALTLLNPSPAIPLDSEILSLVDFLVPNEGEAQALTGVKMKGDRDLSRMAQILLTRGAKNVVITLGPKGLFFKNLDEEIRVEAFRVKAVDSTAAGDAFMGALAVGLSEGMSIPDTLTFASASGALATTKLGAQPSLPLRREVERFLKIKGHAQRTRILPK